MRLLKYTLILNYYSAGDVVGPIDKKEVPEKQAVITKVRVEYNPIGDTDSSGKLSSDRCSNISFCGRLNEQINFH